VRIDPISGFMRVFLVISAAAAAVALVAPTSSASHATWATQANQVCSVWIAKAKKEFGSPATPAQLYSFAHKAKTLETLELGDLVKIPGRTAAGTAALAAVRVDIAEIGSAITAWDKGNPALFIKTLQRYLNDRRPKSAFAIAGAGQCG
jgi:hypothetical protein